jgi:hypothetical protein
MLVSEHVYTQVGVQRPVVCGPGAARVRFALDGAEGDVQLCYDPPEMIRKGRAQWLTHLGGSAGDAGGVSGVRALLRRVDGWARLTVVELQ